MKKVLSAISAWCLTMLISPLFAQVSNYNFVRTWDATAPEQDGNVLTGKGLREVKQTTSYIDGLGRPMQTVIKNGSLSTAGNTDMVAPVVYDQFGREVQKYLPYAAPSNDGFYKGNAFGEQANFFGDPNGVLKAQGEAYFYSQTDFEPSPLDRVIKTMAPGNSWVGSNKGVEMKYWINTLADDVKQWTVTDAGTDVFGLYTMAGTYPAGQLYKNATIDENSKQVIEFKDKDGKVILKKVQLVATADDGSGRDYSGWLSTYYIYDDLNQLRAVIQPQGVELLLQNNWNINALSGDILNEQCFRYEYDERGRMVDKKVPGAAYVYFIYDPRDRLLLTQDGNQRNNYQYQVYKYDALNRPVITGIYTYYGTINDARYLAKYDFPYEYEEKQSNSNGTGYTSRCWPEINYELLTITHYDDYDNLPSGLSSSLDNSHSGSIITSYNTSPDYAQQITKSNQTLGMVTWTTVKVIGTSVYLSSVNIYDEKGKLIQVQSINQTGGTDVATTQYDFAGKILRTHIKLQKASAAVLEIATKNNYDDLGRITKVEKQVNNSGWKAISEITYDALGQAKTKKLAPDYNSGSGLDTLTYDYNIRGWMLGANRDYAKDPNKTSNYFGFDLGYDKQAVASLGSYVAPQLNGNITGTVWKSKGDNEVRKYDFTYDAVNRLTGADFNQYTGGFNRNAGVDFSVSNLSKTN